MRPKRLDDTRCSTSALRSQLVNFRNVALGGYSFCGWEVVEAVWLPAIPGLLSDVRSSADWKEG